MSGHGSGTARLMREVRAVNKGTTGRVFMREVLGAGLQLGVVHESVGRCRRKFGPRRQCEHEGILSCGLCVACWDEQCYGGERLGAARRRYCVPCRSAAGLGRVSMAGIRAEAD